MASRSLLTALSPSSVAVLVPSSSTLRIALYQRATGLLQTTLVANKVASSSIFQLLFNGDHLTAVGRQSAVVWDVTRGVVVHTIEPRHNGTFLSADTCDEALSLLHTTAEKLQIHQYRLSDAKLVRKVKVSKEMPDQAGLATTEDVLVVRGPSDVRILSAATGHKRHKVRLASSSSSSSSVVLAVSSTTAVTTDHKGSVISVDLVSGKVTPWEPTLCLSSTQPSIVALGHDYWLVDGRTLVHGDQRMSLEMDASLEASAVVGDHQGLVGVLCKAGQWQVQSLPLTAETFCMLWRTAPDPVETTGKRRAEAVVLGPAQAGGAAWGASEVLLPVVKRSKASNEEEEDHDDGQEAHDKDRDVQEEDGAPTVGERLALLRQALDAEESEEEEAAPLADDEATFVPKKATTESLTQLLQQALQASDDAMLELALQVHDVTVLKETCRELEQDLLLTLLAAVTTRLSSKPARADQLCVWLQAILGTGRIRSLPHLQPLQNLLQERLEVFPSLLKLEGRLSLMGTLY